MKRVKVYIPMLVFLVPTLLCTLVFIPRSIWVILGFAGFLSGFIMTYCSMVNEIRKNSDAVLKIGEKGPIIFPIAFFMIPNIIGSFFFMPLPQELSRFVQFYCCISGCILTYFTGVILVISEAKRNNAVHSETGINQQGNKRLILINPVNPAKSGLTVNSSSIFPPLGLGIIAALTPLDYEIVLIDENVEAYRFEKGDIVGITAFTSSASRAYEIAAQYREAKIPVIMGRIHASIIINS